MDKTKTSRNIWLWPILYAIGCDLFFFWVVNFAFLTGVKGLSSEQFFMLDLIGAGVDVLTTIPFLFLIAKIGNNTSLRVATFMMMTAALLFTFGNSFIFFIIANILYFKTYQFFIVYPIILENNLEKYGRKDDFIGINARGRLYYSILSLAVALVAGFLFDYNAYLPMFMCVAFTVIAFVASFFIRDETGGKYEATKVLARQTHNMDKSFLKFTIMFVIFMVLFKGCWYIGSQYTKVSLEEIGMIVSAISIVIFVGRSVRVVINCFVNKIIKKAGAKLGVILPILLTISLSLMSLPLILLTDFTTQLILISIGVIILFCIHDLYMLFLYDIIHRLYPKEMHLKMFWFVSLFDTVGILVASVIITCAVANLPVGYALLTLVGASALCIGVGAYITCAIRKRTKLQAPLNDQNSLL